MKQPIIIVVTHRSNAGDDVKASAEALEKRLRDGGHDAYVHVVTDDVRVEVALSGFGDVGVLCAPEGAK